MLLVQNRASNAHPVPTRPLVIALQCVQAEFISAEQLPLNVAHILKHEQFCGPLAWQQLINVYKIGVGNILQANAPPNFHAFRSSNDHPVLSLYTSHVRWLWHRNGLRRSCSLIISHYNSSVDR